MFILNGAMDFHIIDVTIVTIVSIWGCSPSSWTSLYRLLEDEHSLIFHMWHGTPEGFFVILTRRAIEKCHSQLGIPKDFDVFVISVSRYTLKQTATNSVGSFHAFWRRWFGCCNSRFVQFYTKFEEEGRMNDEQADLVKAHDVMGEMLWRCWMWGFP